MNIHEHILVRRGEQRGRELFLYRAQPPFQVLEVEIGGRIEHRQQIRQARTSLRDSPRQVGIRGIAAVPPLAPVSRYCDGKAAQLLARKWLRLVSRSVSARVRSPPKSPVSPPRRRAPHRRNRPGSSAAFPRRAASADSFQTRCRFRAAPPPAEFPLFARSPRWPNPAAKPADARRACARSILRSP